MTDLSWGTAEYEPYGYARRIPSQKLICAVALLLSVPIGLDVLHSRSTSQSSSAASTSLADATPTPPLARRLQPVTMAQHATQAAALAPLRRYAAILDPNFVTGTKSASFGRVAALRSAFEPTRTVPLEQADAAPSPVAAPAQVASLGTAEETEPSDDAALAPMTPPPIDQAKEIPLPLPRPDFAAAPRSPAGRRLASAMSETPSAAVAPVAPGAPVTAPAAPTQGGSFFDKMFGAITRPNTALGYAAVEPGELGRPAIDRYTAVYDISAHTVTLPDGRRLEAHSGLGPYVDDPSSVALHMRGATPPNLYELTPREAIFHGVRALRLTPTGGTTYGRGGLLTHSYMLRGRSGESNGCVVFRNYEQFIAAYDSGMIRRLLVVAHAS